jgi:hypothetical protein
MKCRYRFPVHGRLRLPVNLPVPARGWVFEFETDAGIITSVQVTVPLPRRTDWPLIERDPAPGVKATIQPRTPHLPFIQRELRALQGLLALFGLHSIELEYPEVQWLPESEEERAQLHIFSYKITVEDVPDDAVLPVRFDVLARSIIAADAATDIEIPLNFFRKGMLDVYERNYIEGIYDFYFILETLFGEGKFKTAAVSAAFLSSSQLRSCVQRGITDPGPMIMLDARIRASFEQTYGKMSVDNAIEKMIELRGYLHHHTSKRRGIWNPEDQHRYEVDALFFQTVTYNVIFAIAEPYLYSEDVVRAYEDLVKGNDDRADPGRQQN